ncbi:ABC transporter substrate-binding protein [Legionella sp. CNM-1927-20]|uniref:ABC transporter substrate-binding protein n=1 Tax=Legionella sp. CNM-1927-20 TaxID=3422221 RepID=UPI00403AB416
MNLFSLSKIILLFISLLNWATAIGASEVKICLTGRVVGNLTSYGQSFQNSVSLALEQSGSSNNIRIKNYFYDNKPLEPIKIYRQMKRDGCSAIIGFEYLSDLLLAIKVQKNEKIPIFTSYASTTQADKLPKNVFIFMPSYDYQCKRMMNFLHAHFSRIDNVLLITEINRDEMLKYKEVYTWALSNDSIKYDTFDFLENDNRVIEKLTTFLKDKKYNFVFLLSGAIASAKIADIMNNHNTVFIGTENFGSSVSQTFYIRLKNKEITSYFIRNLDFIKPNYNLAEFENIYTKKYSDKPTVLAAYTYDAMKIILACLSKFGFIDTNHIFQVNYSGITGAYLKDGKFQRSAEFTILSVNKNGYKYEK